jgi:hypothetical protein
MLKPFLLGGVTGFSNFPYKVFEGFSNLTSSLPDTISRYGVPFIAGSHCIGVQFFSNFKSKYFRVDFGLKD